jgi:hypothetical protein
MYELEVADQELERRTFEKSQQLRRAGGDQRESLRKELNEVVSRHFEVRQQRRELMLQRMEKELSRMREELKKRSELREQIVNRRLSELTGERGDLDF